jgi:hypothetical protein
VKTCVGLHMECGTLLKGLGVTIMGFTLFIGSIYILLAALFGRWMGYLVLSVAFYGWMILFASMWYFGFWAQGPTTKTNLGPRGLEPAWVPLQGGLDVTDARYDTFAKYPESPWATPTTSQEPSVLSVSSAVTTFLAEEANAELGREEGDADAVLNTQFVVDDIHFAPDGNVSLAVVRAFYTGGGPLITVQLYHDSGSVPRYSLMFLGGSLVLFAVHLPLLDRAEKKRKEFLTGGNAPPWYGPA